MPGLVEALNGLRQVLDLGSNVTWFIANNVRVVLDALHLFIFRTANPSAPLAPFTSVQPVQSFTPLVQLAADSGLTAVITWASFRLMWARVNIRSQFVLRVLLPRVLLAAMLINFSVPIVQAAVDSSNALSDSVALATHQQILADAREFAVGDGGFPGLQGVTLVVLFACYVVLAFAYVIRFALLVVLTILAPAAALLFVLPETHNLARLWGSLFVSALLMQPLQLLVLALGFALDASSSLPVRHVFALAAVFIAFKVPSALHSASWASSRAMGMAKRDAKQLMKIATKA